MRDADAEPQEKTESGETFRLSLANFEGPFDLLLSLIAKHELDITELSLSTVTDEFLAYLQGLDESSELEKASEFLVVAATLLDLKIVSLLPHGEFTDAEDVALFEARDLLFSRLLQYRAFKEVAAWFGGCIEREVARHPRSVQLEERFRSRAPELKWTLSVQDFAALAAMALTPRAPEIVALEHLHAPLVSIREQAARVVAILRDAGPVPFRKLLAGVTERGVVVARFLAVLELYRRAALSFDQPEPLGELTLSWNADNFSEADLATLGADYE